MPRYLPNLAPIDASVAFVLQHGEDAIANGFVGSQDDCLCLGDHQLSMLQDQSFNTMLSSSHPKITSISVDMIGFVWADY